MRHDSFGQAAVSLLSHATSASPSIGSSPRRATPTASAPGTTCTPASRSAARAHALQAADAATSRNERADHLAIAASLADPSTEADLILRCRRSARARRSGRRRPRVRAVRDAEDRVELLRREKNIAWCAWWAAQPDLVWPALERAVELLTPDDTEIEVTVRMLRARYLARCSGTAPAAIAEARAGRRARRTGRTPGRRSVRRPRCRDAGESWRRLGAVARQVDRGRGSQRRPRSVSRSRAPTACSSRC